MPGPRVGLIRPGPRLGLRRDLSTIYVSPSSGGLTLGGFSPSLSGSAPPFIPDFFISPTGGSGTGSLTDPWSLSYALSGGGGAVAPGEQGAIRGGTYQGTFTSGPSGTAVNPIIFRQFPGEHANVIGQIRLLTPYLWLWGIEITGANAPGPISCVDMQSSGGKLINLVMHDATDEIVGDFHESDGSEIYGCLGYNAGPAQAATPNAYSWYGNNITTRKLHTDCIGFNTYQYITHFYDGGLGQLNNLSMDGCVGWGGGAIRNPRTTQADFVMLGSVGSSLRLTNCHFYEGASAERSWSLWLGVPGDDLLLDTCRLTGFTSLGNWTNAVVQNNTFYSLGASPVGGDLLNVQTPAHITTWANNTHYRDSAAAAWMYGGAPANGTAANFAAWKAATGLGVTDTNAAAPSGVQVFVRPNKYEAGRANIIIYNWSGLGSVPVDLSSVLSVGQAYVVLNAENFYGAPAASGVYTGAAVTIPMAAVAPPTPLYGRNVTAAPATGPAFQVFILRLAGA